MLSLLALLSPSSSCPTCIAPTHSWATLPVSFHASAIRTNERGEFSAAQLATVARFPLVTLEKWQGSGAVHAATGAPAFLWEEDAWVAAARQVKAARKAQSADGAGEVSVVAWMDSTQVYTGWVFPPNLTACAHCTVDPRAHGALVNHTYNADVYAVQGRSRAAEYMERRPGLLVANTSDPRGAPATAWGGLHVYDFAQPAVQALWRQNCLALTASGAIDGCGADFSGHPKDASDAWIAGHEAMLRDTTRALGSEGLVVGKDWGELGDYVSAILHEGCTASNDTITSFRALAQRAKASGARLVAQCHFGHPNIVVPLNATAAEDTAAAFLCGAGADHYYVTGPWRDDHAFDLGNFSSHWLPSIMGRPLGAPLADAVYEAEGAVWSRAFASGTKVTFDARANRGSIAWSDEGGAPSALTAVHS